MIQKNLIDHIVPAVYNGNILTDYMVDRRNGDIYSLCGTYIKRLKWQHRNRQNPKVSYPCMRFRDRDAFPYQYENRLTVNIHIIIHESLTPLPQLPGVTDEEWAITPDSVKAATRGCWIVNHKDHNKLNFHPSNLEWVFGAKENAQRAREFYANQLYK